MVIKKDDGNNIEIIKTFKDYFEKRGMADYPTFSNLNWKIYQNSEWSLYNH